MRTTSILSSVRRHWIVAVLLVSWVTAVMVVFAVLSPAVYRSTATVFLSNRDLASALTGLNAQTPQATGTEARIAALPSVIASAKRDVGGEQTTVAETAEVRSEVPSAPNAYQESSLLMIVVDSRDRAYSKQLADAVAARYVAFRNDLGTRDVKASRADVVSRMKELEARGQDEGPLYSQLASRLQTLDTLLVFGSGRAQILEPADSPEQVAPQPARAAVQGLLVGILFALAVSVLLDRLNVRVRSATEIVQSLGLPSLGALPSPASRDGSPNLVARTEMSGPGAEAFRTLRAHIKLAFASRAGRRMLVTSASPGEGKSFVSANLALTAAAAGEDVLLLDLDLRRASLHRYLDLPRVPGIADVISGDVDLTSAMVEIDCGSDGGRLRFLPAGREVPNPGELVSSEVMAEFLRRLPVTPTTWMVVDTPPVLAVGDATALVGSADATLVVSRAGHATRRGLERLRELLGQGGHRSLGVVLTGTRLRQSEYYSYAPTRADSSRRRAADRGSAPAVAPSIRGDA